MEPAGPPPAELSDTVKSALPAEGARIVNAKGETVMELWFATASFPTVGEPEMNATLGNVKHGVFAGVVRIGKGVQDRRGDGIKPGVFLLRLSFHPIDGSHQGIAPQRDFLILTNPATDKDISTAPSFKDLMTMAGEVSGTTHPRSLSCWKQEEDFKPGLHQEGERDWVLHTRIGGLPVVVIVVGQASA